MYLVEGQGRLPDEDSREPLGQRCFQTRGERNTTCTSTYFIRYYIDFDMLNQCVMK